MSRVVVSNLLGLIGAAVGGVVGYVGFLWLLGSGFYAMILPGGLVGLGCNLLARHHSTPRGVVCAVAGAALGLFAEWRGRPFAKDDSLGYFLAHLTELSSITWLMIAAGAFLAFWFGRDHYWEEFVRQPDARPEP